MKSLVQNLHNRLWSFVTDPQFTPSIQSMFNHERKKKHIEKYLHNHSNPFNTDYDWKKSSVSIPLPHKGSSWPSGECDSSIPTLTVDGIYHHDIIDIVTSTFQDQVSSEFHLTPFEQYWQPNPEVNPIKVFGEAYSSPKAINLYHSVHGLPQEPEDDLERIIIPILLWSDATQPSNFGDVALWPIYMFFGNQSKYTCGKPTVAACHHVAYIYPDGLSSSFDKHTTNPCLSPAAWWLSGQVQYVLWRRIIQRHLHLLQVWVDASDLETASQWGACESIQLWLRDEIRWRD